jgi:succinyl-CoA synthetase beta subunit
MQERHVPMVVRIVGTNAQEAARILAESGDPDVQTADSLDEAVEKAVAVATAAGSTAAGAPA